MSDCPKNVPAIVAQFPNLTSEAAELLTSLLYSAEHVWREALVHAANVTGGVISPAVVRHVWASIAPIVVDE